MLANYFLSSNTGFNIHVCLAFLSNTCVRPFIPAEILRRQFRWHILTYNLMSDQCLIDGAARFFDFQVVNTDCEKQGMLKQGLSRYSCIIFFLLETAWGSIIGVASNARLPGSLCDKSQRYWNLSPIFKTVNFKDIWSFIGDSLL